jgi:hypothetical protein
MRISTQRVGQLLGAVAVLILCALPRFAYASIITYTNRATFLAATASTTTIDFSGIALATGAVGYNTSAGTTISGVQFVGTTDTSFQTAVIDRFFCCPTYNRGQPASLAGPLANSNGPNPRTVITLPGGITAVGMDLFTVIFGDSGGSQTDTVVFSVGGNQYSILTAVAPNRVFFGFTSDAPISTFTVKPTRLDDAVDLAFFTSGTGAVSGVPEPGTAALMALGCLDIALRGRSSYDKPLESRGN